jgi:5-deoxy-glucuronate isomerase
MAKLVRHYANHNHPIVDQGHATLDLIYFNPIELAPGGTFSARLPAHESVVVVQSGSVDISVDGELFPSVGQRQDIWSGNAEAVYVPLGAEVTISARTAAVCAIAGGITTEKHTAFRITPDEVEMVDVGSPETHSRRRIFHVLGQRHNGRVGRLLVSELLADPGCWSGYPPHKHDTEEPGVETDHEELYHYRFMPESGFGSQALYETGQDPVSYTTREGDTFLLDKGYHPTVTSPGRRGYIFTILVGRHRRGLVQRFDPQHQHLVSQMPGIQAMRNKFK